MIALAVYLNGKKLTVAGAEDLSVLHAIVNAIGPLGKNTARKKRAGRIYLHLSVGGLTGRPKGMEDEHLRWVRLRRLRVGDRVSVRIIRTTRASKHQSATSAGGNVREINEKRRSLRKAQAKRLPPGVGGGSVAAG